MEPSQSNIELKEFSEKLNLVVLPSTLWAIHVDPEYQFIAVLHVQLKTLSRLSIDKCILLTSSEAGNTINISYFINNEVVYIPELISTIKSATDLSHVIYVIHSLKLCINVDNHDYPNCAKYIGFTKCENICPSCSGVNNKKDSADNLWKDINTMQEMQYTNSVQVDNITVNHISEDLIENENEYDKKSTILETNSNQVETEDLESIKSYENCYETNKVYKDKKQFLCEICNKASNRKFVHQRHMLTHSNARPNLCNICGKTFCEGYQMKDHLLTHSSEKPFQCEICCKTFAKSYNLKLHQKTHSGVRPFICSTCGKTYTTQSNLSTHIRSTHTNRKPHACSSCHMSFVHPHHLRLHMRKHTGEKPYKCVICEKTFSKNIHLTIHIRTHTGEKPHLCTICGKGFTTTGNLNSHKRVHHKEANSNIVKTG